MKALADHRASIAHKCQPGRLRTSPQLTAMLAYLLDEHWTDPILLDLREGPSGRIAAQAHGDLFAARDMGRAEDLVANIKGAARACGLTNAERRWLLRRAASKIAKDLVVAVASTRTAAPA